MVREQEKSIGHALTLAARMHRARMAELLTDLGLYPGQEQALQFLAINEQPTMGELADALNVKAPTVSKTIARLSQQSLVERKIGEGDGRLVRVGLTQTGRERAAAIVGLAEQIEQDLTKGLDGKDKKRLRRLLRKAAKNLAKASGRGHADTDVEDDLDDELETI
ncbi:MarR family winged helix-turn-helix transcriptional regulator [Terrarubrum flagellatum]|uniref:MarR family winged helix-turn-helix transcriptional regulator n=1 Tax=Terrirubrum flagellatum TaxID=2895980 RepID=UPI0031454C8A